MSRRLISFALVAAVLCISICQTASAIPRWRRGNNNYNNYSSGFIQVGEKFDDKTASYPILSAYSDYDAAQDEAIAFTDKFRIALNVWDEEIMASSDPLVAEVNVTAMNDLATSHVLRVPVTLAEVEGEEFKSATFDLVNEADKEPIFVPATVYRMFISLHRESEKLDEKSAWGQIPGPYYAATSGESLIERARHKIVMRTFREWYYTERGWHRNAEYPMDCHAYYLWATGSCTVGASNGWTNLGAVFGTYHSGGHIAELMDADKIHGDYVRIPGHTFMLLAYDAEAGQVWTMEANFNHTIEVCRRSVGSGWQVGHLEPEHIRADLFGDIADAGESAEEVATMPVATTAALNDETAVTQ